jgi:hypothetical protein
VSCCWALCGTIAWVTPDSPPIVNIDTNPIENSIEVVNRSLPPHRVNTQLKILMPVGTAMNIVASAKAERATGPMAEVNMWCAHTPKPMNPIAAPAKTTAA